jgi:nucleotide sugar dehydrogenase
VAPDGSVFPVPTETEAQAAYAEIARAVDEQRDGSSVVAVQGLGFVGTAVAAALVSAGHRVIGVDLPGPGSYWKLAKIAAGLPPVGSPDPALEAALSEGVAARMLHATPFEEAYGLADVIVVDVDLGLDGTVRAAPVREAAVDMARFEQAIRAIGRHMRPDALVVVETTVPVGTCRAVVIPALVDERRRRGIEDPPLLANAYERVMPGPRYLESVRAYPRSFAGIDPESSTQARAFLESFVEAPLRELPDLESAELGKLLENSYRAANIAFIHEWTLLAESIGVDLWTIVDSIRARVGTHDNIRDPGFGVGGYCLTKDSLLAQWGAARLLGSEVRLETTLTALEINAMMPLHTLEHVRTVSSDGLAGCTIAVCGVAYLPEVADTRNSPTETLLGGLEAAGVRVRVHDPHVVRWPERPDVVVEQDLRHALTGADGVVLAVPHRAYIELGARRLTELVGRPSFVVDAQNILDDVTAAELRALGWRVSGVGKGHWRAAGYAEPA